MTAAVAVSGPVGCVGAFQLRIALNTPLQSCVSVPLALHTSPPTQPVLSSSSSEQQPVPMDYSSTAGAGGKQDEHKVMEEVQATLRMQYIQEFYQTVRDHCFKLCITSPGSSLSSSDQKCLGRCMDRYQDATGIVTKAVLGMQGMQ